MYHPNRILERELEFKYWAAESGAGEPLHGSTDGDVLCDDAAP